MARASVELIVEAAKAVNPLRKVEQQSKKVDRALKQNQKAARNVEAAFQRMGRNSLRSVRNLESGAARLGKRMGGLRANVAKAAVAFGAFRSAQVGIQRVESERRIKFLAESYGEVAQLQDAATASAKKFGTGQTEANRALADVFARLRPVGVGLKDIVSIYNGFNTAARISGSTATEASNAFTQLAQALGSGALRGDEFNSISEQVPGILTAISKETGVAQGQLRKYAAEGKITSDVVIRALKRIETEGADQLKEALGGPAQAIADFQNATEDVQVALTETVVPELSKSFVLLAEIINDLKPVIQGVGSFAATVLGGVANTIERIRDPRKLASEVKTHQAKGLMAKGISLRRMTGPGMSNLGADYKQQELALGAAAAKATVADTPLPSFALGGGVSSKAAKERVDMTQKLFDLNQRLREQQEAGNEREVATLELMIKRQEIAESNLLPLEQENELQEALYRFRSDIFAIDKRIADQRKKDQADAAKALEDQMRAEQEAAQKRLEADPAFQMKKQLEELLDVQNQVQAGAAAIGNAFANSFKAVVTGSKSGQEALADMMSAVAEHFMNMASEIIAQQLTMILYGTIMKALGVGATGGGGFDANPLGGLSFSNPVGFANGGFVDKPTKAIIGEGSEPEYVIPESKMRESMARYSRGSRGDAVLGGGGAGDSGEEGGVATAAPIDVRYTVERINSVDYVTADQFQAGMQQAAVQGAKQGEQQTLKRLQMSGSTRKRIGL